MAGMFGWFRGRKSLYGPLRYGDVSAIIRSRMQIVVDEPEIAMSEKEKLLVLWYLADVDNGVWNIAKRRLGWDD